MLMDQVGCGTLVVHPASHVDHSLLVFMLAAQVTQLLALAQHCGCLLLKKNGVGTHVTAMLLCAAQAGWADGQSSGGVPWGT